MSVKYSLCLFPINTLAQKVKPKTHFVSKGCDFLGMLNEIYVLKPSKRRSEKTGAETFAAFIVSEGVFNLLNEALVSKTRAVKYLAVCSAFCQMCSFPFRK